VARYFVKHRDSFTFIFYLLCGIYTYPLPQQIDIMRVNAR